MSRIPKNEPDLFAVLFWRTHLLAGKRSYQLGEITTEYLNLDSQTVRKLSERVDELVPVLHRIMDEPDKSLAVAVQKNLNAFYDVLFSLPPYRDLPMDFNGAYNMFPMLASQTDKWSEAMTDGTERNQQLRRMLELYEALPVRLDAFRNQVSLTLELDFEDLPRRNGAAYGRAFAKYYQGMRSAGMFFSPDEEGFEQGFDAAIRFIPIRDTDNPEEIVIGEETQFQDIVPFLYTDFYRGLIHGNAPRRCHNCGRYFLLTAGYNTCYCNNIAPGETERTCRKVGAHRKEAKGRANRSPAKVEYDKAYLRLKQRKLRGKITVDEWNTAVAKAQELLEQSEQGKLTDEELTQKLKEL